jgi:hypothetical protein
MGSSSRRIRFVALGDSYTIGTSVGVAARWPNRLVDRLPELELVAERILPNVEAMLGR